MVPYRDLIQNPTLDHQTDLLVHQTAAKTRKTLAFTIALIRLFIIQYRARDGSWARTNSPTVFLGTSANRRRPKGRL